MSGRKDVAKVISELTYSEMCEMSDELVKSVKEDENDDRFRFDKLDRNHWSERLRWWAEANLENPDE